MNSRLLRSPVLFLLLTGLFAAPALRARDSAKPVDDAALDALWSEYSRVAKAAGPSSKVRPSQTQQKVSDQLVEEAYRAVREAAEAAETSLREYNADYSPRQHTPGEMDLMPTLEEVPEPVASLPAAKSVNLEGRYDAFVQKLEMFQKQLADQQQRNNKYVDIHQREGDAGLARRAMADAAKPASRSQTMQSIQLQQMLGTTLGKMQNVALQLTPAMVQCEQVTANLRRQIQQWSTSKAQSLPTKVMGETTVKEGLADLLKMQAVLTYAVDKQYAETSAYLWRTYKTGYKYAIGEFNNFIGEFGWGKPDSGSIFQGTYEEPMVAAAVNSVYVEMIRLTKDAKAHTSMNKGRQEQFEIAMQ